jgi:glycosyltransferase involved in cell wall biosynthesis
MKKISCIIPAYNEEKGIGGVLAIVAPLVGKELFEVIVIDDGSRDKTKEIVKTFPQIKLIEHEINKGKSRSVADGIRRSEGDYIFMLDADLKFLNEKNVVDLISPIENEVAQVCLGFIKNSWPLFPFKQIDYLCGVRMLPKDNLMKKIDKMELLKSYGLEIFINRMIIRDKLSLKIVHWPNVENVFSQQKVGWQEGMKNVIKIWSNVIGESYFFGMYYQNIKMLKLIVKESK